MAIVLMVEVADMLQRRIAHKHAVEVLEREAYREQATRSIGISEETT